MNNKLLLSFLAVFVLILPLFASNAHASEDYSTAVKEIGFILEKAYDSHRSGDARKAKACVSEAYFEVFEGKGLEGAIGAKSPAKKAEIEALFSRITGQIGSGAGPALVRASIDELMEKLRFTAVYLEKERGSGSLTLFADALIIMVREGFEAILIISALAAYLVKTGKAEKVRMVYAGGAAAVLASLFFALLFQTFFSAAGAGREALEGITMLMAAVVLFYVSYWFISKAHSARWRKYIKSAVEGSLSRGNVYAIGFAAFLAVFREGAETVLFYQALYSSSGGETGYLLGGVGLGIFVLAVIFLVFRYGIVKVPLGPFFAVTSTLLYYLAFTFSGKGILELQGAGWISTTPVRGLPSIGFLGIYPSWEGLSIQVLLILAMFTAVFHSLLWRTYMERGKMLRDRL